MNVGIVTGSICISKYNLVLPCLNMCPPHRECWSGYLVSSFWNCVMCVCVLTLFPLISPSGFLGRWYRFSAGCAHVTLTRMWTY